MTTGDKERIIRRWCYRFNIYQTNFNSHFYGRVRFNTILFRYTANHNSTTEAVDEAYDMVNDQIWRCVR